MRPEHISDALGLLSDEMLEQARTAGGKEKRMRRRKYYAALILVAFTVVVGGFFASRATAFTPQEVINMTFEAMGVEDAKFEGKEVLSENLGVELLRYTSGETGLAYYFNEEDGSLSIVRNEAARNHDSQAAVMSAGNEMSPTERRDYVLDYAQACIAAHQIGDLEAENISGENAFSQIYYVREYYNGIPTGTRVDVICRKNGEIYSAVTHFGTIFRKNSLGIPTLRNEEDFISSDEAKNLAQIEVEKIVLENGNTIADGTMTVELSALENEIYYQVNIDTVDESRHTWVYKVAVDAYSGEILDITYSG